MKNNGINLESYFATQGLIGLTGDESNCCGFTGESSFDEFDDSQDDQESVEYENEEDELPGVREKCPFGEFRTLVRAKKQELKDQYGKGRISIGECGIQPFRLQTPKYNPIVRIGESKVCIGWGSRPCVNWKEAFGQKVCVGWGSAPCVNWKTITEGNTAAYDNATARFNADKAAWDQCRNENKGIWVPGWRRKWREFKKYGGLNEMRAKCRGVSTPVDAPIPGTYTQSGLDCAEMASKYGIIAGKSWGTAPVEIRREWQERGCRPASKAPIEKGVFTSGMSCRDMMDEFGIIPGQSWGNAPGEAINAWKGNACTGKETDSLARGSRPGDQSPDAPADNKKLYIIIGAIVLVVLATMFIIKRQMK